MGFRKWGRGAVPFVGNMALTLGILGTLPGIALCADDPEIVRARVEGLLVGARWFVSREKWQQALPDLQKADKEAVARATRPEWSTRVIFARPASASAPSLGSLLGIGGWPHTFVADHRGHIVYRRSGLWARVTEETTAAVRRALKAVPKTAGK